MNMIQIVVLKLAKFKILSVQSLFYSACLTVVCLTIKNLPVINCYFGYSSPSSDLTV